MTGSDRRTDADRPETVSERAAERPRVVPAAFAVVVFGGSVVPVPTASSGRHAGGVLSEVVNALPAGVGFTVPFHVIGYAVLAALLVRAATPTAGRSRRRRAGTALTAATAATAFGFGIELVQAPIPWRSFAWGDAAVNAAGAVVGAAVAATRAREGPR
ncbi:hypothetical protein [Halorubrum sp. Boch-26]|uniref:hypothetical protein n=1 Tax=Halorubrum sp. Boch-26 TaxID=2994426 RepID=UPI0024689FD3|nr:hypothetical protein [Halorubrum sp. Boch-26]